MSDLAEELRQTKRELNNARKLIHIQDAEIKALKDSVQKLQAPPRMRHADCRESSQSTRRSRKQIGLLHDGLNRREIEACRLQLDQNDSQRRSSFANKTRNSVNFNRRQSLEDASGSYFDDTNVQSTEPLSSQVQLVRSSLRNKSSTFVQKMRRQRQIAEQYKQSRLAELEVECELEENIHLRMRRKRAKPLKHLPPDRVGRECFNDEEILLRTVIENCNSSSSNASVEKEAMLNSSISRNIQDGYEVHSRQKPPEQEEEQFLDPDKHVQLHRRSDAALTIQRHWRQHRERIDSCTRINGFSEENVYTYADDSDESEENSDKSYDEGESSSDIHAIMNDAEDIVNDKYEESNVQEWENQDTVDCIDADSDGERVLERSEQAQDIENVHDNVAEIQETIPVDVTAAITASVLNKIEYEEDTDVGVPNNLSGNLGQHKDEIYASTSDLPINKIKKEDSIVAIASSEQHESEQLEENIKGSKENLGRSLEHNKDEVGSATSESIADNTKEDGIIDTVPALVRNESEKAEKSTVGTQENLNGNLARKKDDVVASTFKPLIGGTNDDDAVASLVPSQQRESEYKESMDVGADMNVDEKLEQNEVDNDISASEPLASDTGKGERAGQSSNADQENDIVVGKMEGESINGTGQTDVDDIRADRTPRNSTGHTSPSDASHENYDDAANDYSSSRPEVSIDDATSNTTAKGDKLEEDNEANEHAQKFYGVDDADPETSSKLNSVLHEVDRAIHAAAERIQKFWKRYRN